MDCGGISNIARSMVTHAEGNDEAGRGIGGRPAIFKWPDPSTDRLRELVGAGKTYDEVAEILNEEFYAKLTRKAIANRANFVGLKSCNWNKWPAEVDAQLKALFSDPVGYSHGIIADKLNAKFGTSYTRNSVIGRCHRMGMTRLGHQPAIQKSKARKSARHRAATPAKPKLYVVAREPRLTIEIAKLRCAEIVTRCMDLLDLGRNDCRWPDGDGPFTFCGHPIAKGSYCAAHHQLSVGIGPSGRTAANGWVR